MLLRNDCDVYSIVRKGLDMNLGWGNMKCIQVSERKIFWKAATPKKVKEI
jgi:hypothetical protein